MHWQVIGHNFTKLCLGLIMPAPYYCTSIAVLLMFLRQRRHLNSQDALHFAIGFWKENFSVEKDIRKNQLWSKFQKVW